MNVGELKVEETADGELYFRIPDEMLDRLGWVEGDEVKFVEKDRGFLIKKIKYETVQLDFDEDELFEYMQMAHDMDITFNEFVERALENVIDEVATKIEK